MKKLIYAVCVSSLALAVSAGAADNNDNNLLRKGRGTQKASASTTQGASVRNSPQVNVRRNPNRPLFQQRSFNTQRNNVPRNNDALRNSGVVHQNNFRHHDMSGALRRGSAETGARNNRVTRAGRNFEANHSRNVTVDRQRNFEVNRSRNTTVDRRRNFEVNRSRNTTVDRQRNFDGRGRHLEVNRQRDITRNHERKVTINNNWHGPRFLGPPYAAFRNYHREWHDRNWWRGHHTRIIFVSGGWYYWNVGYWYPAWGYDPGCSYPYDGPIYGYNNLTPDQVVVNVQEQLTRDGYYTGPIDGDLGPMTRQAIADFQADHGLAITSSVDEPTLASLGLV